MNILLVVVRTAFDAFSIVSHVQLFTKVATRGIFHEPHVTGGGEVEQPAFFFFRFGLGCRRFHERLGEPYQLGSIGEQHLVGVGFSQIILAKIKRNLAQLGR